MSGGLFDYQEWHLEDIANTVRETIMQNRDPNWIAKQRTESYLGDKFEPLPEDILKQYEEAYRTLYRAKIYATRIDYLESGDDGEDSFRSRLADELAKADEWFKVCFSETPSEGE